MWIPYALASLVGFALWGLLGKLALDHATWAQVSLLFGVAVLVAFVVILTAGVGSGSWSAHGLWLGGVTGVAGAIGLAFFYLALERGKASEVVPVIGIYPAVTAVLAVVFIGEGLTGLQLGGVALAVAGVLLVGLGG